MAVPFLSAIWIPTRWRARATVQRQQALVVVIGCPVKFHICTGDRFRALTHVDGKLRWRRSHPLCPVKGGLGNIAEVHR